MSIDRDIDRAVASGERNKRTIELVRNWCAHAKVKKFGGVGLVEQQTGLPIGHHSMECDYAPAGGMAAWDFADAALDFYDRNCVGCAKRQVVRLPNLSNLVEERSRAQACAAAERERQSKAAQEAASRRRRARESLRAGQAATVLTLLDDFERLDLEHSEDARVRIVETAKLAPEVFTPAIVNHVFDLLDAREHWFTEAGLQVLQYLSVDKRRLMSSAMRCLSDHDATDTAASLVQENLDHIDPAMVPEAVPALALLARSPRSSLPPDTQSFRPAPLLAVFGRWPQQVCAGIAKLLDQRHPYWVMTGARSLSVIAEIDPSIPLRFVQSLSAKLARAHLLIDEDESSRGPDDVCADLQEALSLALLADPVSTDETLMGYYEGASREGEARLIGVYKRLFAQARRDDKIAEQAGYATVLRRLIWAATTSPNDEVLREVLHAFYGEPDALADVARSQLDLLLGSAALMDDRVAEAGTDARIQRHNNMFEALERSNRRHILYQLSESFTRWAAAAAGDDDRATSQYVEFLMKAGADHEELSSTLVGQTHFLMHNPRGLNAVLPVLYSALVGASNLMRASAAKTLGKLDHRRVSDLPNLVFEAFIPLLRDPYVVVHQSAVRALERFELPDAFDSVAASALSNLIVAYKDEKASHTFLMDCIALFVQRYVDDEAKRKGVVEVLVALIHGIEPDVAVRKLRHISRKVAHARGYAELVLRIVRDDKAMAYLEEDVMKLLYDVPAAALLTHRTEVEAAALNRIERRFVVSSFLEVLTRVGAWPEAQRLAQASWEQVPDTIQMRQVKWSARLQLDCSQLRGGYSRWPHE